MKNLYHVLNIDKNCTKYEIKQAYKLLAIKYHPDKNSNSSGMEFKEISEAYQVLYDDKSRKMYDSTNNYTKHQFINPENLYNNLFSDIHPKIIYMTKKYYDKILELYSDGIYIFDIIKNLNKNNLLQNGSELLKEYILYTNFKNSKDIERTYYLKDLKKDTKILIPICNFFEYKFIKVNILYGNNKSYMLNLQIDYLNQDLNINKKKYEFSIVPLPDNNYKTINNYDLYTNIEIGIDDYAGGFFFTYFHYIKNISVNVDLIKSKSMTIKFPKYGIPIWSTNEYGDLYVNFFINPKIKTRFCKINKNENSIVSESIDNIIQNINLYT